MVVELVAHFQVGTLLRYKEGFFCTLWTVWWRTNSLRNLSIPWIICVLHSSVFHSLTQVTFKIFYCTMRASSWKLFPGYWQGLIISRCWVVKQFINQIVNWKKIWCFQVLEIWSNYHEHLALFYVKSKFQIVSVCTCDCTY